MEAELKKLRRRRSNLKTQLNLMSKFLNNLTEENLADSEIKELEQRLNKITPLFDIFNETQSEIDSLEDDEAKSEEARESFQNLYFSITTQANATLSKYNNVVDASSIHSHMSRNSSKDKLTGVKLPPIELPTFSGSFTQWREFYDVFGSLIHNNDELSNGQKLFYLRASLKGEPAEILNSLETTDLNYVVAWEALRKRYDNKRRIIQIHIQAILNLESLNKDTQVNLRQFINTIETNMQCLAALQQQTETWDALIIQIVLNKLDFYTTREWEARLSSKIDANNVLPTFSELLSFLNSKLNTIEALAVKRTVADSKPKPSRHQYTRSYATTHTNPIHISCPKCKGNHSIQNCEKFLELCHSDKLAFIKQANLCINCFRKGHNIAQCRSSNCRICQKRHNTALHIPTKQDSSNTDPIDTTSAIQSSIPSSAALVSYTSSISQVLLPTARVQSIGANGKSQSIRVLLDSGSQSNFITQQACEKLGLHCETVNITVSGIGQGESAIKHKTQIKISSLQSNHFATLSCYVLPQITARIPSMDINRLEIKIPAHVKLADPYFNQSASLFYDLLATGQCKIAGAPILQNTKLGWIVSGCLFSNNSPNRTVACPSLTTLHNDLQAFWKIDEIQQPRSLTPEEEYCETFFTETTTRNEDGRFIVKIPFKPSLQHLGDSLPIAKSRFTHLENKFQTNKPLKTSYTEFIHEYESLNHMTRVHETIIEQSAFYLPHHPVFKADSETTKLRVVFDGSCKPTVGLSLNQVQCVGPTIQHDLFSVVARFRTHEFAVTADIAKMYRQILVHPSDRKYQRILWRDNPENELETFELNTVTYGLAASSFLAIRCIKQIAIENENKYPIEARILKEEFYVDDLLSGSSTIEGLREIRKTLNTILKQGGFVLRKWKSNVLEFNEISEESPISISGKINKTLGIYWNPITDTFFYSTSNLKIYPLVTKRTILATTAQLFDPLGFLAPIIIVPKMIIQKIWQLALDWDDILPSQIYNEWINFKSDLKNITHIEIPRFSLISQYLTLELHGFSDASERAYGACLYVKATNALGHCTIKLLTAKSRVAPLKNISLPRLELLASVTLAQFAHKFKGISNLTFDKEFHWTDSQIVLSWISAPSNRWTTFVANRVSVIQELTCANSWRHVKSSDNPADLISRGCSPKKLINSPIWWEGPNWLKLDVTNWPKTQIANIDNTLEMRKTVTTAVNSLEEDPLSLNEFSSLNKLVRTISYCLRFSNNCHKLTNPKMHGPLTKNELEQSLMKLVKISQIESFRHEHTNLSHGKPVNSKSKILSLTPFMDSNSIIRVGGRLQLSNLPYDKKHPIILSNKHFLTKLLFEQEHKTLLHAGPTLLLSSIRNRFWPISGRSIAKGTVRKCVKCFRYNPQIANPLMGSLPAERVKTMPPFHAVGVDYAGPLLIRNKLGRGSKNMKCYICIFICFATKAIHLEPVTALTTDAFIATFRRFVARRGKPLDIYSDNGQNFVGANAELRSLSQFIDENANSIVEQVSQQGVNWHFIPARSPHFGGLWEAGVKSTKHHLKRVMHDAALTFEDLYTVLTQIESLLNSRPLAPLSSDPNDLEVLTPAHFLIGRPFTCAPDADVRDKKQGRLSRFQHLQQITQHFWDRWSREYLSELQQRSKWKKNSKPVKVNDVVLVLDDNTPPAKWKIGRILLLHPGKDNITRVVTVQCASGIIKRSLAKICVLPID